MLSTQPAIQLTHVELNTQLNQQPDGVNQPNWKTTQPDPEAAHPAHLEDHWRAGGVTTQPPGGTTHPDRQPTQPDFRSNHPPEMLKPPTLEG